MARSGSYLVKEVNLIGGFLSSLKVGWDNPLNSMSDSVKHKYNYKYLSNVTGAQKIFDGNGTLHYITVNQTTATTVGIIDGAGATANVGQLKTSIAEGTYRYDVTIANGLTIKPAAHCGDMTICFTQQ